MTNIEQLKNAKLGERKAITGSGHIVDYTIATAEFEKEGKKQSTEKVVFTVDISGRQIEVDKIAYINHKEKRNVVGTWLQLQEDGTISPVSGLGNLMSYYDVKSFEDMRGCLVVLIDDGAGYSAIRSYD